MDLFGHIKKMYEHELYANVLPVVSLLLTAYKGDRQLLTADQHIHVLMMYANSLYAERLFKHAEIIFRQVLQAKQSKAKVVAGAHRNTAFPSNTYNNICEQYPVHEIKYRIAVCLQFSHKYSEALTALTIVPHNQRTPKINMLMARLKQQLGHKDAASHYKEVLREFPLNLEAIKSLLATGTKGIEVNSLVVDTTQHPQCADWFPQWIKALALMYTSKFHAAIEALLIIMRNSKIGSNELILAQIGECAYFKGDTDRAICYLTQARSVNPQILEGLEILAVCWAKKNNLEELEMLTQTPGSVSELRAEHWCVMATLFLAKGKMEKASYFIANATNMNPRSIEAVLIKAKTFFEMRKYKEALANYISVQPVATYRYDIYKGIVDVYLATNRYRDAQMMASGAVKYLGQTPRTLVLVAHTYYSDLMLKYKAKPALLKALEIDSNFLPAVCLLVETYRAEGATQDAVDLLRKHADSKKNANLYALLGDILAAEKDVEGAMEHYTIAINLMPMNKRAISGLVAMGQPVSRASDSYVSSSIADDASDFQENSFSIADYAHGNDDEDSNSWRDVIQRIIGST